MININKNKWNAQNELVNLGNKLQLNIFYSVLQTQLNMINWNPKATMFRQMWLSDYFFEISVDFLEMFATNNDRSFKWMNSILRISRTIYNICYSYVHNLIKLFWIENLRLRLYNIFVPIHVLSNHQTNHNK